MSVSREIIVYCNTFWTFYNAQNKTVQKKIDFVIGLVQELEIVPAKFLKHLKGTDGLYEMRIKVGSNIFRVFCFFDEGRLVILLNAFQKKTQKTPEKEIDKAMKLKVAYYESKE